MTHKHEPQTCPNPQQSESSFLVHSSICLMSGDGQALLLAHKWARHCFSSVTAPPIASVKTVLDCVDCLNSPPWLLTHCAPAGNPHLRHVQVHLVAVKVRVVRRAHALVEAERPACASNRAHVTGSPASQAHARPVGRGTLGQRHGEATQNIIRKCATELPDFPLVW